MVDLSQTNRINVMNRWLKAHGRPALSVNGFCNGDAALWGLNRFLSANRESYKIPYNYEAISEKIAKGLDVSALERSSKEYLDWLAYQKTLEENKQKTLTSSEVREQFPSLSTDLTKYKLSEKLAKLKKDHEAFLEAFTYFELINMLYDPKTAFPGFSQNDYSSVMNFIIKNVMIEDSRERKVAPLIEDENKLLETQFKFSFHYNSKEELIYMFENIIKHCKHNKIIQLQTDNHTFSLYYNHEDNTFDFFDPNSETGATNHVSLTQMLFLFQKKILSNDKSQTSLSVTVIDKQENKLVAIDKEKMIDSLLQIDSVIHNQDKLDNSKILKCIYMAVVTGDLETIKIILSKFPESEHKRLINSAVSSGNISPLRGAAQNNHLEVMNYLISKGANIEWQDNKYSNSLQIAACNGNLKAVELLVDNKANIDARFLTGTTALYSAVEQNHYDVAVYLLKKGANKSLTFDPSYNDHWTPLRKAINDEKYDFCQLLLKTKDNQIDEEQIKLLNNDSLVRLLCLADIHHDDELVKYLKHLNPMINKRNDLGFTPLNQIASCGYLDEAKWLVGNGVKINKEANDRSTPLYNAVQGNHSDVVRYLIAQGANPLLTCEIPINPNSFPPKYAHWLPLRKAIVDQNFEVCQALLINKDGNIDLSQINKLDSSLQADLLMLAAKNGDVKLVTFLLGNNSNLLTFYHVIDTSKWSAIRFAIAHDQPEVLNKLIEFARTNVASDIDGMTPLILASTHGKLEIVEMLTQMNTNLNIAYNTWPNPRSALDCAILNGHESVAVHLIKLRAVKPTSKDVLEAAKYPMIQMLAYNEKGEIDEKYLSGLNVECQIVFLEKAMVGGDTLLVSKLLAQNPDLKLPNESSDLQSAAREGNLNQVIRIIENGTDVNARDNAGITALHEACRNDRRGVVEYLLTQGADKNLRVEFDGVGNRSPLDLLPDFVGNYNLIKLFLCNVQNELDEDYIKALDKHTFDSIIYAAEVNFDIQMKMRLLAIRGVADDSITKYEKLKTEALKEGNKDLVDFIDKFNQTPARQMRSSRVQLTLQQSGQKIQRQPNIDLLNKALSTLVEQTFTKEEFELISELMLKAVNKTMVEGVENNPVWGQISADTDKLNSVNEVLQIIQMNTQPGFEAEIKAAIEDSCKQWEIGNTKKRRTFK